MENKGKIIKAKKLEPMKRSTSTHYVSLESLLPLPESGPTLSPLQDPLTDKAKEKVAKQKLWNSAVRECHVVLWSLVGVVVAYSLGMKSVSSTWPIPFNSLSFGSILVYAVSSMVAINLVDKPWRAIPDVLALAAGLVAVLVPLFYLFGVIFGTVFAIVFVLGIGWSFWFRFRPTQPESGPTSPLSDPLIDKAEEQVAKQKLWNSAVRECHVVLWSLVGVVVAYSLGMKSVSSTWPIPFNSLSFGSILVYAVSSMVAINLVDKPWRAIPDVLALAAGLVAVLVPLFYLFGVIFGTVFAIVFVLGLGWSFWFRFRPTQPESGPTSPLSDPLIDKAEEQVAKQKLWNSAVRECHVVLWSLVGVVVAYSLGMKSVSSTWPIPFNSLSFGSILVYAVSSMVAINLVDKPWRAIPDVLALATGLVAVLVPLFYLFGVIFGTVTAIVFVLGLGWSLWFRFRR